MANNDLEGEKGVKKKPKYISAPANSYERPPAHLQLWAICVNMISTLMVRLLIGG